MDNSHDKMREQRLNGNRARLQGVIEDFFQFKRNHYNRQPTAKEKANQLYALSELEDRLKDILKDIEEMKKEVQP